eukprot:8534049-Pyramimonas_sp.AAC.1
MFIYKYNKKRAPPKRLPKPLQDGPRGPQDGPSEPRDGPRAAQEGPKKAPRSWPKGGNAK